VPAEPGGGSEARRRATAQLLWLACRRRIDATGVVGALEAGADPALAVPSAVGHRLAGLLWRALGEAGALEVLGDQRTPLAETVEVQRMRELLVVPRALELAVGPLVQAGIEPVVLKGPAVAVRYPGTGLRPFDDLDLLVPHRQHVTAVDSLVRAGWVLARPSRRDRYDSVLVHPSLPDLPLELHYALEAWYDRASSLDAEELWRRRRPVELHGVPCFALPTAEELVVLCAHAAKPYHGFSRLIWIADLAMVLGEGAERGETVAWDRVQELARAARCRTAVAAALSLSVLAGADVPSELCRLPDAGWPAEALRRLVAGDWVLRPAPPIHLRFALADDRRRRFMLLLGYTHPMPGVQGVRWRIRTLGHAVRRWSDLRSPASEAPAESTRA
jgi:hypothetical protein